MDPVKRNSIQQSIKAHRMHAKHDPRVTTAKARAAWAERFLQQADPEGVLSPEERERRAYHLMRAHMKTMALKSAEARSKKWRE
mgnify:CR=1 FL=1